MAPLKVLLMAVVILLPSRVALAQETEKPESKFKFYGFFRNYTVFDTRDNYGGTEGLFFFAPKDEDIVNGKDINAIPSFRSLAITTRLGLDFKGYKYGETNISGKIETDFYTKNGNAAVLRVRQVYLDLERKDLSLRIGQAWHPMAADQPNVIDVETGSPFAPFARSPQLMLTYNTGHDFILTAGFITQMQYQSTGPDGKSSKYLNHGILPEIYAGAAYDNGKGFIIKAGLDILSIKPRISEPERITTLSPFIYAQYTKGKFQIKGKSIYASAGEHLNLLTGYGVSSIDSDGSYEYTPMQSTASFISVCYGKKWQILGMLGYMEHLGTTKQIADDSLYWSNNSGPSNFDRLLRIDPAIQYNAGKLQIALEYDCTVAQFGTKMNDYMLIESGHHWVACHRILLMVKFNF